MTQTEEEKRNKSAERMRKMRGKSVTNGVTSDVCNIESVTDIPEHLIPILAALGDKEKRSKIRLICKSLDEHNVTSEVRYGINGPTMDKVSELLEAF